MTVWELTRAETFLYQRLEPDTTLRTALGGAGRVFIEDVPQSTTLDKVLVIQNMSAVPIACQGPSRLGMSLVYWLKVIGQDLPHTALAAALDRVEALMYGVDVTVTVGGAPWRFTHNELADPGAAAGRKYTEPSKGGVIYRHAGRLWPLIMQAG